MSRGRIVHFARSVISICESFFELTPIFMARLVDESGCSITGIPADQFLQVAKLVGETGRPDKVMTIVYAVGLTHHTTGVQLIRSAAILQLLLGNVGRPGGGMNAERGHANIQGNTDHAISWEILPGYLRIPAPGQRNLDFSMYKNFQITEQVRVQFRAEAFNATNTPYFGEPNNIGFSGQTTLVPDSARMGEVRSIRTAMRIIQFGLKLSF